ncbi:Pre-mRNA 3'-end-processing factor FIP1 [Fasciolopsis buskii]|uniref:Pre-mRNA 3'-end-processing factor FIP1 n=1 Tax=Fasciolopsis buskii TaxID=27845 RepID=A0A8E0RRI1_9TREM|nr:Pre-mRNA 3'-end-processing factor FIP1 [Fasciolopsis buski]
MADSGEDLATGEHHLDNSNETENDNNPDEREGLNDESHEPTHSEDGFRHENEEIEVTHESQDHPTENDGDCKEQDDYNAAAAAALADFEAEDEGDGNGEDDDTVNVIIKPTSKGGIYKTGTAYQARSISHPSQCKLLLVSFLVVSVPVQSCSQNAVPLTSVFITWFAHEYIREDRLHSH